MVRRTSHLTLALVACAAASSAVAPAASAALTRAKCPTPPEGVKDGRDVACGFVSVPQRHGARNSKRYRVAISVVKAHGRRTRRPLVILGGGPGEAVAASGPLIAAPEARRSLFGRLNRTRDLILVDQRGAGSSQPALGCTREERALTLSADDAANTAARVQVYSACAARLKAAGIDLSTFTTSQIAYDLRRIVGVLELGRVDVLAVSHGTKVALLAASRDERWLRRLVLASAILPGANFVTEAAGNFTRALNATFAACQQVPQCATSHPDPAGQLEQVMADLKAQPLAAPASSTRAAPAGDAAVGGLLGAPRARPLARAQAGSLVITAGLAASALFGLYYQPLGYAQVPALIAQLATRDPKLLSGADGEEDAALGITVGQFFAVECAEELAGLTPEALRASAAPFGAVAREFVETNVQIGVGAPAVCAAFDVPATRAQPANLERIHRPTLVVNGTFDQVTPPNYGTAVARGIRGARLKTFPAAHSPITQVGFCGYKVVARFLDARRVLGGCSG
jgi:pimeloyl-ACP methyl ester carboxylesterase